MSAVYILVAVLTGIYFYPGVNRKNPYVTILFSLRDICFEEKYLCGIDSSRVEWQGTSWMTDISAASRICFWNTYIFIALRNYRPTRRDTRCLRWCFSEYRKMVCHKLHNRNKFIVFCTFPKKSFFSIKNLNNLEWDKKNYRSYFSFHKSFTSFLHFDTD